LDLAKSENLIEGYARVATIDEMKRCIRENKFVYTGTNKCDWEQTNLNKSVFQKGSGYGHCFCIVGYDDAKDWFIAKNSF
jgi:C1A family cysteine protease